MTSKPVKIPARQRSTNENAFSRLFRHQRNYEPTVRRKAWYLRSFVCCEMTEENMEAMREELGRCRAVKTEIKMTPTVWTSGKRDFNASRLKKVKIPLEFIHSIEQDEKFVNVLLCIRFMHNMPDNIKYEIDAYKFHYPDDAREMANAFQEWTGVGPIEKAPSIVNGSVLVRSVAGGSMHSLSMPGRPTTTALAPSRWVAVERPASRRYMSASMGDLTAPMEVAYTNGARTVPRNGMAYAANGTRYGGSMVGGYRYRGTPEQQTMTSDEGNGSLSFSDHVNQQQHQQSNRITYVEVSTAINEPVSPTLQPVINYQRYRPYAQNNISVADIACQVVIPDSYMPDRPPSSYSFNYGPAVVITGGGRGVGSTRMTRSSGIGRDWDEDEFSSVSGQSSTTFDDEPRLTARGQVPNGSASLQNNGIAAVSVPGYGAGYKKQNSYNGVFDETDQFSYRRAESRENRLSVPSMTSQTHRIYHRPNYSGSEIGMSHEDLFVSRRSRYQSDSSGQFYDSGAAVTRSRSVGPQVRYARSDLGVSYQTNGGRPMVVVDNSDAMSVASSAMSGRRRAQGSVLIQQGFEKSYVSRHHNTIYRQAPRPVRGSSSSGYGGVRSRTMSHKMR